MLSDCKNKPRTPKYRRKDFEERYVIHENYLEIKLFNRKGYIASTIVDLCYLDLCKQYSWYFHRGYVHHKSKDTGLVSLHRLIMGAMKGIEIDHINGNPLDNRRENLRIATRRQQLCNTKIRKSNKFNVKGVSFDKSRNKYKVDIKYENTCIQKRFDYLVDAINFRKNKECELFGEYARK